MPHSCATMARRHSPDVQTVASTAHRRSAIARSVKYTACSLAIDNAPLYAMPPETIVSPWPYPFLMLLKRSWRERHLIRVARQDTEHFVRGVRRFERPRGMDRFFDCNESTQNGLLKENKIDYSVTCGAGRRVDN